MNKTIQETLKNQIANIEMKINNHFLTSNKEELKGEVILRTTSDWPIEKIEVTLNKREYIVFEAREKVKENQKNVFKNQKFQNDEISIISGCILANKSTLLSDDHIYSVRLEIPEGNAASFFYEKGNFQGRIEYFIKAEVVSSDENDNLIALQDIDMKSSKNSNNEFEMLTKINIKSGFCNNKKGDFCFKIDKCHYISVFNENKGVFLLDNSKNSLNISKINLTLIESIEGKGKSESGIDKVHTSSEELTKWQIEGAKAKTLRNIPLKIEFPKSNYINQITTSRGKFLKKDYKLLVEPDFDKWNFCTTKLSALSLLYLTNEKNYTENEENN